MFWGKRSRPVFTHFPGAWPNVWGAQERGFNCVLSPDVFCSGCYWAWHFEEANAREMSCRCRSRAWVVVWVPHVCSSHAGTLARCGLQSWGAPGLPLGGSHTFHQRHSSRGEGKPLVFICWSEILEFPDWRSFSSISIPNVQGGSVSVQLLQYRVSVSCRA